MFSILRSTASPNLRRLITLQIDPLTTPKTFSTLPLTTPTTPPKPTSFPPLPLNINDPEGRTKAIKNTEVGIITSTKMQKTVTIEVKRVGTNRKYGKSFGFTSKYLCHDEHGLCSLGDYVRVKEGRPLSKRKRYTVIEIVKKKLNVEDYFDDVVVGDVEGEEEEKKEVV